MGQDPTRFVDRVEVSDVRRMADADVVVRAEEYLVSTYKLSASIAGSDRVFAYGLPDSSSRQLIIDELKEAAWSKLCRGMRRFALFSSHGVAGYRDIVVTATMNLPYIKSQEIYALEGRLQATQHTRDETIRQLLQARQVNARLRFELATPWLWKLLDRIVP
jgi:hypothetical protein